jgi:hypothetical protein
MYKVTEEIVRKEMDKINEEVFANFLYIDDIELDIDYLEVEDGFCFDEHGITVLGLTDEFQDKTQFRTILAHEMIHALQIQLGVGVNHGEYFKKVANFIKEKLDLNIEVVH